MDPAQFARANQSIQMACQNLVDPACTQSQVECYHRLLHLKVNESHCAQSCSEYFLSVQVLSAATIVAKHTSALCNACRLASSKTPSAVAKRQFVQSAKEVANTTANLVKSIKVCNPSSSNRRAMKANMTLGFLCLKMGGKCCNRDRI